MRFWPVALLVVGLALAAGCDRQGQRPDDLAAAQEAARERDWAQTARLLQRYLRDEDDPEKRWTAWNLLVSASYRLGEEKWVIDYLETMQQEYGRDENHAAAVQRQLALGYEKARQWDKAAEAWLRLLDLEELSPQEAAGLYRRMGLFYLRGQEYGLAEDMLEMCVAQAGVPQVQAECQYYLAQAYATDSRLEEALVPLDALLDRSDVDRNLRGQAFFLRGDILEQQNKRREAAEAFARALPLHPNPPAVQKRIDHLNRNPLLPAFRNR